MIKKWIASLIIGIIVITCSCLGSLQYGRDMDVCGSHITSFDNYEEERLSIVINKLYVANQKACAEEIVKRCRENSFKSVRFSYDQAIPNALYVIVYGSNWQVKNGKALFSFSYLPGDMNGTYNIVNDSEKYILRVEHN